MKGRKELYLSAGLVLLLALAGWYFFSSRDDGTGLPGVLASDTKFEPLQVEEPELRMDLLEKIRKLEYTGSHRNIFDAAPLPPPRPVQQAVQPQHPFMGPKPPPPPPPLQVPVEFFGYASEPHGGRRVAFFSSGDDVLVVGERETFLGRFRVDRITNDWADVEEIATGRHATLPLVEPPEGAK
jgi:hypothetical protein